MTDLSPEAQAAKDAAQELYAGRMARKLAWPLDLPVIAAALRAVAHRVDWESGDPKFLVLAIADELDAESPTP